MQYIKWGRLPTPLALSILMFETFKKTSRFVCLTKLVCASRIHGIVRPIVPILIKIQLTGNEQTVFLHLQLGFVCAQQFAYSGQRKSMETITKFAVTTRIRMD